MHMFTDHTLTQVYLSIQKLMHKPTDNMNITFDTLRYTPNLLLCNNSCTFDTHTTLLCIHTKIKRCTLPMCTLPDTCRSIPFLTQVNLSMKKKAVTLVMCITRFE
ncbi:uncharacterized protein M6B38_136415 [Iris pallida]|uniref:Uncharacterized protein n=1 Tax=Iris pallida TaxID=29817 RepID=A0AAX6FG82_IRIPA|nr:uncharacterized protein M6B38_136415 [Iris pallida]